MRFITIPDIENVPILINIEHIQYIKPYIDESTGKEFLNINLTSLDVITTSIPRPILLQMLNVASDKPQLVQPTTEFEG